MQRMRAADCLAGPSLPDRGCLLRRAVTDGGGSFKRTSAVVGDPSSASVPIRLLPDEEVREKAGITVVQTGFQHDDMRDTGPDEAKASIQSMLDEFLVDEGPLKPVETKTPPPLIDPGPVAPYVPQGTGQCSATCWQR